MRDPVLPALHYSALFLTFSALLAAASPKPSLSLTTTPLGHASLLLTTADRHGAGSAPRFRRDEFLASNFADGPRGKILSSPFVSSAVPPLAPARWRPLSRALGAWLVDFDIHFDHSSSILSQMGQLRHDAMQDPDNNLVVSLVPTATAARWLSIGWHLHNSTRLPSRLVVTLKHMLIPLSVLPCVRVTLI